MYVASSQREDKEHENGYLRAPGDITFFGNIAAQGPNGGPQYKERRIFL
jgi:hypothetical protein